MDYPFKKSQRLRRRGAFIDLDRRGRKMIGPQFIMIIAPGQQPVTRLGVTVSRKVGGAVVRNRIKRHLREIFRLHPSCSCMAGSWDINLIARRGAASLNHGQIFQSLRRLLLSLTQGVVPSNRSC